jgi:hypothetical protein
MSLRASGGRPIFIVENGGAIVVPAEFMRTLRGPRTTVRRSWWSSGCRGTSSSRNSQREGTALRLLRQRIAAENRRPFIVGLGDAVNDLSFLSVVDRPIVIPRPNGLDPGLSSALPHAERAPYPGPRGWNAALLKVLAGEGYLASALSAAESTAASPRPPRRPLRGNRRIVSCLSWLRRVLRCEGSAGSQHRHQHEGATQVSVGDDPPCGAMAHPPRRSAGRHGRCEPGLVLTASMCPIATRHRDVMSCRLR